MANDNLTTQATLIRPSPENRFARIVENAESGTEVAYAIQILAKLLNQCATDDECEEADAEISAGFRTGWFQGGYITAIEQLAERANLQFLTIQMHSKDE